MRNPSARACAARAALLALGLAGASAAAPHVPSDGRDVRRVEVAPGVHQFTVQRDGYVRLLNSVAVIGGDGVVVFDTDTRPSSARLILAELRKLTGLPVRTVINSHWHPDHWSGNEVWARAFPGVEIVSTGETRQFMQAAMAAWPARFAAELERARAALEKEVASGVREDGSPLTAEARRDDEEDLRNYQGFVEEAIALERVLPTMTYEGRLVLHRAGRELQLLSVTGDAEGTTALWLPRERVLITGDAVSYPIPYVTPPPLRHARALRELARLAPAVIVPGHGPAFRDLGYLELEAELLESVAAGARAALQRGARTLAEVQAAVTAEPLRARFTGGDAELDGRFRERVKALVRLAVREARDGQDLQ